MNKQQISAALRGQRPEMVTSNSSTEPSHNLLEDLITRAVRAPREQLLPPIASTLGGREVFVELAKVQSEDGQPIMKTFAIEHLPSVLRAYTARSRPNIRYGGMQWEALKEMVKAATHISGIQIVNEADDWVVFDRAALGLHAGD